MNPVVFPVDKCIALLDTDAVREYARDEYDGDSGQLILVLKRWIQDLRIVMECHDDPEAQTRILKSWVDNALELGDALDILVEAFRTSDDSVIDDIIGMLVSKNLMDMVYVRIAGISKVDFSDFSHRRMLYAYDLLAGKRMTKPEFDPSSASESERLVAESLWKDPYKRAGLVDALSLNRALLLFYKDIPYPRTMRAYTEKFENESSNVFSNRELALFMFYGQTV